MLREAGPVAAGSSFPTPSLQSVQELLLEHIHDAVFATDLDNRITHWSASAERLFGYATADAVGRPFGDLLPFEISAEPGERDLFETIGRGDTWRGEGTVRLRDGSELWIESSVNPVVIDGRVVGAVSVSRDMTVRKREADALVTTERALRESQGQFRDAFEYASIGMALVGLDGRWLKVNPAIVRMLGYSQDELLATSFQDLTHPDDLAEDLAFVEAMLRGSIQSYRMDKRYRHRDGHVVHATLSVSLARDADGRPRHFIAQVADRSAEAHLALEAQIQIALADVLATLPEGAGLELAAQRVCAGLGALPWVDLAAVEAFEGLDDAVVIANWSRSGFPTQAGDHLSARRARYLHDRAAVGPWADRTLAGDGPDDFALARAAGLEALAYSPIGNGKVTGVLMVGTSQRDYASDLVDRMPGMGQLGTTVSILLGDRLHARGLERQLRATLERELAEGAFRPVFQPIVELDSRRVVGYEALTRFDSGARPDQQFQSAWAVGLGPELELATLEAAIVEATRLPAGSWLDVNVSPRLLAEPGRLCSLLRSADRPIVLEVTEHEPVGDYAALRDAIRDLGPDVRLAVDDAGAGAANFGHIVELRPDFVKLDQSLVRRVHENLGRQALVVAMRHFARTAGCRLVAEGVEEDAEAATLEALGVEYVQGYLFGRPAPIDPDRGA